MNHLSSTPPALLVIAVAAVGVFHTLVPDHWLPIALLARQQGWSRAHTARAAALAGFGHTLSTLAIAAIVWLAGFAFAARFGKAVDLLSGIALIAFGLWIAAASLRELRAGHGHEHFGHAHAHRHSSGLEHVHWHEHHAEDRRPGEDAAPPLHDHAHPTSMRTALLLILGSSPMIEGIPAFFAASRYGVGLLAVMSVVFAASTMLTYVALCVTSAAGAQALRLGVLERYGEVLSGGLIAGVGVVFLFIV